MIFKKISDWDDILFNYRLKKKHLRILRQVEFHVVNHCNLNCCGCDHFSPLADKWYANVNHVTKDFKQLAKIFDFIKRIHILGGEPLLHPDLIDFFKPVRKYFPYSKICLITNGTLLEKQTNEFWEALKRFDITLSMTYYPIKAPYEFYAHKCYDSGIDVELFFGRPDEYFFRHRFVMTHLNLNVEGKSNEESAYRKCQLRDCHFLEDGKLYVCPVVSNIKFLNQHFNLNFKSAKTDYVDIYECTNSVKINKWLSSCIPFCRYCSTSDRPLYEFSVSGKQMNEWLDAQTLSALETRPYA